MGGARSERIAKSLLVLAIVAPLELIGYGPRWVGGLIGTGVAYIISPISKELGLVPDYNAFEKIPIQNLKDQSPTIIQGLDAYNRMDFEQAYQIWTPLAEAGNAEAQYRVGRLFGRGEGVKRSPRTASDWFRKAAEQEHSPARTTLAILLLAGEGVPQDSASAISLLLESIADGEPYAANALANSYMSGRGVPVDPERAYDLYRKALAKGVCAAGNALATLHYRPVPPLPAQDLIMAYRYAAYSKQRGCVSRALLYSIENDMTAAQAQTARSTPLQIDGATN